MQNINMDDTEGNMDWDLLARYLSGECSPEEEENVRIWAKSDPRNAKSLEMMRNIWNSPRPQAQESDIDRLWAELAEKAGIASPAGQVEHGKIPLDFSGALRGIASRQTAAYRYMRIAAIFIAAALLPYLLSVMLNGSRPEQPAISMQKIKVQYGKQKEVILEDGSTVVLDAGSEFSYPEKFSQATRDVYLSGEGYLKIAPDAKKPFIVHAQNARIEVVGTEFNVRAWNPTGSVAVVVFEGKVALRPERIAGKGENVIIEKGQMSTLLENGKLAPPLAIDVKKHALWLTHEMEFRSAPFREVLDQIERWHDVQIELTDQRSADDSVTFHLKNESIQDILETISLMMNMKYKRNGRMIRLSLRNP